MDRRAWRATVHRVPKSWIRLSHTQTYLFKLVFLSSFPEVKFLGHLAILFLIILEIFILFSLLDPQIFTTILPTVYKGSLFSAPSSAFVICCLLDDSHSDKREMLSHCSFDLDLPDE